jgi:hypothetical protein
MGILAPEKTQASPVVARRKSTGLNFGDLKPLNASAGTKNFGGYRDRGQSPKSKKETDAMDSDADDEDEVKVKAEDDDDKEVVGKGLLSPDDALQQGELAEGVRKIKVRTKLY